MKAKILHYYPSARQEYSEDVLKEIKELLEQGYRIEDSRSTNSSIIYILIKQEV